MSSQAYRIEIPFRVKGKRQGGFMPQGSDRLNERSADPYRWSGGGVLTLEESLYLHKSQGDFNDHIKKLIYIYASILEAVS